MSIAEFTDAEVAQLASQGIYPIQTLVNGQWIPITPSGQPVYVQNFTNPTTPVAETVTAPASPASSATGQATGSENAGWLLMLALVALGMRK